MKRLRTRSTLKISATALCLATTVNTPANGIFRNGAGAESMSMGGTETGWAMSPLGAMAANPAGLGFLESGEINLGAGAAVPEGHFQKSPTADGRLDSSIRAFPEGAIAYPFQKIPVTIGLSFIPLAGQTGDWNYFDSPGGLGGVSYGQQEHRSEIQLLRTALGVGVKVDSHWSAGASIGLLYNENRLTTPYIFQNLSPNPNSLNGAKTLLDLRTAGYGFNAQFGVLFRATTNLQFGLSYTTESEVDTTGDAYGDPYAQFHTTPGPLAFHYDADVRNTFPQMISLGTSWKFHPQWRLALQLDWLDWSHAFKSLPVKLTNGSNPGVNGALGANFSDSVPMNWRDEFVYRAGLEYDVTENLSLRAGWCYGESPVPDATLSPMTAAIMENTLTAGAGYHWKNYAIDVAYQYDLPSNRNVGTSSLLSGEYSNSSTGVQIHWISVTTSVRF
ncbi:MAG TPA: TonB-dependent receptor [Verrucomicrobiae bacterium]|nr:TonB-dependent receptor [Verrucomicrobiae bacterium]